MKTKRKQLDPLTVRFVATSLILATGSTTTLAVKNALRQRGYEASEDDVSQWLLVISLWENWTFTDNGPYRVFHFTAFMPSLQ